MAMKAPPPVPSAYQIERAVSLWQQLQNAFDADPELASDEAMMSGLFAAADVERPETLLEQAIVAAIYAEQVSEIAKQEAARVTAYAKRYAEREATLRGLIEALMDVLRLAQHRTANGILAHFGAAIAAVEIIDEARLPDDMVRTTRVPNKLLIGQRLKDGRSIPGAVLSNPKRSLVLRKS